MFCLWIPQTSEIRKLISLWSNFERYSVLAICLRNPEQLEDQRKIAMLRISRQIGFWHNAESAHNSQNAQFGLVMFDYCRRKFSANVFCYLTKLN